jgi:hypothetical protein
MRQVGAGQQDQKVETMQLEFQVTCPLFELRAMTFGPFQGKRQVVQTQSSQNIKQFRKLTAQSPLERQSGLLQRMKENAKNRSNNRQCQKRKQQTKDLHGKEYRQAQSIPRAGNAKQQPRPSALHDQQTHQRVQPNPDSVQTSIAKELPSHTHPYKRAPFLGTC